jgi:chaperonin GroES
MSIELRIIKPVNGHIVLKQVEESEQMVGNIFLPDLGKEKSLIAEVVDVSSTFNFHMDSYKSPEMNVGDLVLVPRMGSQVISVDGEDFIVCKETDIIGIIK